MFKKTVKGKSRVYENALPQPGEPQGLYLDVSCLGLSFLLLTVVSHFSCCRTRVQKRVGVWVGKCLDAIAQLHAFIRGNLYSFVRWSISPVTWGSLCHCTHIVGVYSMLEQVKTWLHHDTLGLHIRLVFNSFIFELQWLVCR